MTSINTIQRKFQIKWKINHNIMYIISTYKFTISVSFFFLPFFIIWGVKFNLQL